MKRGIAAAIALAISILALGCETSIAPVTPTPASAVSVKTPALTSFTFTKLPALVADQTIASPVLGLETIVFQVDASRADGLTIKQLGFMIAGSLQAGDVGNYQLVYYPQGLDKPGVIMGTNDGSTWVAPGGTTLLYIDLASPITITKKKFTAIFSLRADVTGTGTFFFDPRIQTLLINDGTTDKDVAWFGGDLPLQGDVYRVN